MLNLLRALEGLNMFRFIRDENGQDMIEYGMLASLISIAAVLTVRLIGPLVNAMWVLIEVAIR